MNELETLELDYTGLDYDELAIAPEADDLIFEPWTDDERRAHYAEMYDDELTIWHKEDVDAALKCGAITQEQAAGIDVFDPVEYEKRERESKARVNAELRAFYAAQIDAGFPYGLPSAYDLVQMLRCGLITREQAEQTASYIDDYYRERAARNAR